LLQRHYGMTVLQADPLVSERDQNFRVRTADDRNFVLKIANAAEDPMVTEFQILALRHIEDYQLRHGQRFHAPRIVPTLDGSLLLTIADGNVSHVARVVTFVEGVPLGDTRPSPELCRNIGVYLAEIGRALSDFEHAGAQQSLLWDMKRAADLRELLPVIPKRAVRDRISRCLDDFAGYALPSFDGLRWQVIHNDLNPDNILIDAEGGSDVTGVIDFGDMLKSPLIVDVAVAASYLRERHGDPLTGVAAFVSGYHSVTALERPETDILFDLIRTRLAATISIRYWRVNERSPDDPYLRKTLQNNSAEKFLSRLDELPRNHVQRVFREVCASQDAISKP
jgi:hydroxylysine kinase